MQQPRQLATWNPDRDLWETDQLSIFGPLVAYSETLPRSGMTRDGRLYEHLTLAHPTTARGFSSSPSLPTPTASDADKARDNPAQARRNSPPLSAVGHLLPTPTVGNATGTNERRGGARGGEMLLPGVAVAAATGALPPTPAACNPNDGEGTETWFARRERVKARGINGNGMAMPLGIAVQTLPTPRTTDANGAGAHGNGGPDLRTAIHKELTNATTETGSPEVLRDMRGRVLPQTVQRPLGGSDPIPVTEDMQSELWEQPGSGAGRLPSVAGAADEEADGLREVQGDDEPACASQGQKSGQQQPGQPSRAVRELPLDAALDRGSGLSGAAHSGINWGRYEAAIRRWESVLRRPAPNPTELNRNGNPRLNPALSEWMMGLPAEHVTNPTIGLSRSEQLKAIGNGVCPQQALAALAILDPRQAA